jgi:hypothetical protein
MGSRAGLDAVEYLFHCLGGWMGSRTGLDAVEYLSLHTCFRKTNRPFHSTQYADIRSFLDSVTATAERQLPNTVQDLLSVEF